MIPGIGVLPYPEKPCLGKKKKQEEEEKEEEEEETAAQETPTALLEEHCRSLGG